MENCDDLPEAEGVDLQRFKSTEERVNLIASKFNVKVDSVKKINQIYRGISEGIKYQYLAHVIRTVEAEVRKQPGFELFQIKCVPVSDNSTPCDFGSAQYYEGDIYIIFYDSRMDEKQLRIVIAHELGHLVVETILKNGASFSQDSEPLSSIFGIFTILDKNDFYHSKLSQYQHASAEEIIDEFILLKNRARQRYNISD